MAEWRIRGYVADSDEEDESQWSARHRTEGTREDGDELEAQGLGENRQEGKATKSENSVKPRPARETAVEVRIPNGRSVTSSNHCRPTLRESTTELESGEAVITFPRREPTDDDIDELQQDHHGSGTSAKVPTELFAEALPDVETVVPPQPTVIRSNHVASKALSGHDQLQRPSSPYQDPLQEASIQSSPLSDVASLPDLSPSLIHFDAAGLFDSLFKRDARSLDRNRQVSELNCTQPNAQRRSARNLRQRNPIQLHPYAIEGEKYRQILHARGLKALRFVQEASQPNLEDESQDKNDSQNNDSQGYATQGSASQSSISSLLADQYSSRSSPPPVLDSLIAPGDEEFPDMDALLRRQPTRFVMHGYKRRKMNKPSFKRPRGPPRMKGDTSSGHITLSDFDIENVYNVPPSPPLSGSQMPSEADQPVPAKFHIPPELFPKALPTPLTSSEPRKPQQSVLLEAELSDAPSLSSVARDIASYSQGASSESEVEHQLQQVQRRIRGVLPASWLKLDLKTQKKKTAARDSRALASVSPMKRAVQRGVAHPVSKPEIRKLNPQSPQQLIDLSHMDEKSDEVDSPPSKYVETCHTMETDDDGGPISPSRLGEATEDNQVDAMLPSTKRSLPRSRVSKKRQTRLPDFGVQSPLLHKIKENKAPLDNGIKRRFSSAIRSKAKFRAPQLCILDAPSVTLTPGALPIPNFLKIASRTVRSRRDMGRHSPSHKYISLATQDETEEANQTLRDWRDGTIQPDLGHTVASVHMRHPLFPRSANARLSPGIIKPASVVRPKKRPRHLHRNLSVGSYPLQAGVVQYSPDSVLRPRSEQVSAPTSAGPTESGRCTDPRRNRRQLLSSLQTGYESRPALLETLQDNEDRVHPQRAFSLSLSKMDAFQPRSHAPKPLWERFLGNGSPDTDAGRQEPSLIRDAKLEPSKAKRTLPKLPQLRKRCPQRLEVPIAFSRQPSPHITIDEPPSPKSALGSIKAPGVRVLAGLGRFGIGYTSTFNITPFPTGTCFHESTFVGSGAFQRSLKLSNCDIDQHRGFAIYVHGQATFRWGPWTDRVSSELENALKTMTEGVHPEWEDSKLDSFINLQKHVVNYFSDHLSFLDFVDRNSFLAKWANFMVLLSLQHCDLGNVHHGKLCQVYMINLVIANQLWQISNHADISHILKNKMGELLSSCARRIKEVLVSSDSNLPHERLLSDIRLGRNGPLTVRDADYAEALIIARHICVDDMRSTIHFWDILPTHSLNLFAESQNPNIDALERCWDTLYTLLPYMEFDAQGILETGRRFKDGCDNWAYVRSLINPVLDVYLSNPKGQAASFNTYCRALFSRCLYLINAWGWRKCDIIIGTLFDFFAHNNLNHLKYEEAHGCPSFLEDLDLKPSLVAEPEDRCFHLLLKIIGSGIKYMRELYSDKKVRDLVWRLMPNHGRSHPKEKTIRREDIEALRNHHDLLCTLYWASPPGFRPRPGVIRNLVHLESSHREACHINIRAWSNLVRFQLSTDEPLDRLAPFRQWHEDLLQQIVQQHNLARTEAEEQVKSIEHTQGVLVSKQLLESTIAKNQRQIEAILNDALLCMRARIQAAGTKEAADVLLSPKITAVFSLFDSAQPHTSSCIVNALDVLLAYTEKCTKLAGATTLSADNDDSQDYGDWTAFNDDYPDDGCLQPSYLVLQQVHDPLRQLLSNCFGADTPPDEILLLRLVDVWAAVGRVLVKSGTRVWTDYIGRYGNDAWSSLRETEQTRKFSPYYLACLLRMDINNYKDHKTFLLTYWIEFLVERESLLKFQHMLTNLLLDARQEGDLLNNLPFWRSQKSDQYEITATEFSERRLAVISSVLSNMRVTVEAVSADAGIDTVILKREYRELLKHLMVAMKRNYQELGNSSNLKGAYVDFVHRVIEFLQQHTTALCPIDRFFTDNTAFPLPATDPAYVVGQLKNYAIRLHDPRAPKELAVFLQSLSERAAMDCQQAYLIDQLYIAMAGPLHDESLKPTLRGFFVETIVPVYVGMAFKTACGWILAFPLLLALRKTFKDLLMNLDSFHGGSIRSVTSLTNSFFGTMQASISSLLDQPRLLRLAPTLKTLKALYEAATALLPLLDYLVRLDRANSQVIPDVHFLYDFAAEYHSALSNNDIFLLAGPRLAKSPPDDRNSADIRFFATGELRQALEKSWIALDDRYFVARGTSRREVVVDIGLVEEEQEEVRETLGKFRIEVEGMSALGKYLGDQRMKDLMLRIVGDLML
ncbi:MAG: hypothetical protein Q9163_000330 [Psora crenata]